MKLHEIEISVSISFIGAWPHSTNVCGCSCFIYNSRIEYTQQRPCRLENWKHLLSAPFRKKFADPLSITLKKKKNLNCLTKRVYFSNSNSSSIRCSAPIGINGYPVYVSALLRWSPGVWGQGECRCLSGLDVLAPTACPAIMTPQVAGGAGSLQWELMADMVGHLFLLSSARTWRITCSLLSFGTLWANRLLPRWLLHPLAWTVHLPFQALQCVTLPSPPGPWQMN